MCIDLRSTRKNLFKICVGNAFERLYGTTLFHIVRQRKQPRQLPAQTRSRCFAAPGPQRGARNGDLGNDIVRELLWVRSELGA